MEIVRESVVHVQIAKAMVNKGAELSRQQGKNEDGIRIYDELVERYEASGHTRGSGGSGEGDVQQGS